MILGIGNDIIEVVRIKDNIERYKDRFLNRIFTSNEQNYCLSRKEPSLHFAGRFAAKEAIVKALGTGFSSGISWLDVEICHDERGKPLVACSSKLNDLFNSPHISVSISHCREYATAFAIWTKTE
jgi:holo-[acyl-carrier protein] synthase